jgi:hypothetical protein
LFALPGNDIQLTDFAAPVHSHNVIPLSAEVMGCALLIRLTEFAFIRHR